METSICCRLNASQLRKRERIGKRLRCECPAIHSFQACTSSLERFSVENSVLPSNHFGSLVLFSLNLDPPYQHPPISCEVGDLHKLRFAGPVEVRVLFSKFPERV